MDLNPAAGEKDVYEFFSQAAGKVGFFLSVENANATRVLDVSFFARNYPPTQVRDVQIIRDQRTQKSKGIAYVEFYTQVGYLFRSTFI